MSTKPIVKPSERRLLAEKNNWKDSPIAVAAITAVSTATFFATVVMPIVGSFQAEKLERLKEISANAEKTADELKNVKQELATTKADLKQATEKTPFADGSFYPIGLDSVVIGTKVDDIFTRLKGAKWDEDKSYVSVTIKGNSLVRGAAYYFNKQSRSVDTILIHLSSNDPSDKERLHKYLMSKLGEPLVTKKRKMLWKVDQKTFVELSEAVLGVGYSYLIHSAQAVLLQGEWDEEIDKKTKKINEAKR